MLKQIKDRAKTKEKQMKTVVGLFDDFARAKNAAIELERMGVSHDDISVLANNENGAYGTPGVAPGAEHGMGHAVTRDAGVGAEIGGVLGLLAGLSLFAIPGLGFIAGAGWLAGMFTGAGLGAVAGGLVGILTHLGVPATDAAYYNEGIRRGGVLVAVRADDAAANNVAQMLNRAGAVNIDERATTYRREGLVV
jgi:hypothetical protein